MNAPTLRVWPEGSRGCQSVLDGEYKIEGLELGPHPIIIDCGANIGAFAVWANNEWPGASIFCYEPNPIAFLALKENAPEGCSIRRCAVSMADGKAPLYMGLNNLGESSLKRTSETIPQYGIVKLVHASRLPKCDLLKMDTEGSELDILRNYPHLSECKAVVLEWHSQEDRSAIRNLMQRAGFSLHSDKEILIDRGIQKWTKAKVHHLFVSVLAGGGKTWGEHENCMYELQRVAPAQGIRLSLSKDPGTGVDRARNRQVAIAMSDPSVTHFMFIDNDIVFNPQWVVNMVKTELDVVAGAYPRKEIDWEKVEYAVKNGVPANQLEEHATSWIINHLSPGNDAPNGRYFEGIGDFVEVGEVGTGFLMFKRGVVEKIISEFGDEMAYITDYHPRGEVHHMLFACGTDPECPRERAIAALKAASKHPYHRAFIDAANNYQDAISNPQSMGRYLTEDYRFCRFWTMLGGKIHLYIDASLKHLGTHTYAGAIKHHLKRDEVTVPSSES